MGQSSSDPGLEEFKVIVRGSPENRTATRYPLERAVVIRRLGQKPPQEEGSGVSLNMSSNGILFTTSILLSVGERLELDLSWPALLDNRCNLKMKLLGRITRVEDGRAAAQILRYRFLTAGSNA